MKNLVIILSLIPVIISIVFLGYLIINKMNNFKTIVLVGLMIFIGIAFVFFMKYFFNWNSDVTLSDTISSSFGVIVPLLILIVFTATKDNEFSVSNILPNIKSFNFPTIALLLYVGAINIVFFIANIIRYKM